MALQASLTKTDNFGQQVLLSSLYIKVASAFVTKSEVQAAVIALTAAGGTAVFSETHSFFLDLSGPNPIKQAYLHLKTLPEFSEAVDC
jgi:hypothetical protein